MLLMSCINPDCQNERAGRNRYCWKCMKRRVRKNALVRRWQTTMDTDPDQPGYGDVRTYTPFE